MAIKGKTILLTGGAGFIGSQLAKRLVEDNRIIIFDNLHRNALQFTSLDSHPNVTLIKGDVLDRDHLLEATRGCNYLQNRPIRVQNLAMTTTQDPWQPTSFPICQQRCPRLSP